MLFVSMVFIAFVIVSCGPAKSAEQPPQTAAPPAEQIAPAPAATEPAPAPQPKVEQAPAIPSEETAPGKVTVEDNQASNVVYDNVDMVTNVACNYDKNTVSFHFKNVAKRALVLYTGQFESADTALKFTLNTRQFNAPKSNLKLTCTKTEFAPGDEADCTGEHAVFRNNVQFNQNGENKLLGQIVGLSDLTLFQCGPTASENAKP